MLVLLRLVLLLYSPCFGRSSLRLTVLVCSSSVSAYGLWHMPVLHSFFKISASLFDLLALPDPCLAFCGFLSVSSARTYAFLMCARATVARVSTYFIFSFLFHHFFF